MPKTVSVDKWNRFIAGFANDLVNALKRAAPVDTGHLKNSIHHRLVAGGVEIAMAKHGFYVEFGTPPHVIRPVNGKALKFKGSTGGDVFAKVVHHPGTRPNPFIRNTLRNNLGPIIELNAERHLA